MGCKKNPIFFIYDGVGMTCIYTNLKCFVNGMVDFFDHHLYWHARTAKGTMV